MQFCGVRQYFRRAPYLLRCHPSLHLGKGLLALRSKRKEGSYFFPQKMLSRSKPGEITACYMCTSKSHRLRESISTLEKTLHGHGFVRIHRSVLVNAALVEEIQPWPTGEYALRVKGGKEYTVTRTYKKRLHTLAQLWIGMNGFVVR